MNTDGYKKEDLELLELIKIKEVIDTKSLQELNKRLQEGYKIIAIEKVVDIDESIYYHLAKL